MRLTFFGGAGTVTGANYVLRSGDVSIMVDCGLHQGSKFCERLNFEPFAYDAKSIAAVFVTHAHIDHTGGLPKLYKSGFKGSVYSTPPTRDFAELLLLDSEHLLAESAAHFHKELLYTTPDIHGVLALWNPLMYHQPITVGPFRVTLYNAGHILGSSMVLVECEGKRIIFSGDLGNSPAPLVGPTEILTDIDYCIIESTYGDRLHDVAVARRDVLEDVIEDAAKHDGVLMIPAFAMERTQELLYEMNMLIDRGRVPRVPIFIDSPLAIQLTSVYQRYPSYYDEATQAQVARGEKLFSFPGLRMTPTTDDSKMINNVPPPKIIIAGSGMSNGGRILHHERRYLSDPKSTILFIGYQAAGTLGRLILNGAKEVKIFDEVVPVRAHVVSIPGYSAHADQAQLLAWLRPMRESLKRVFVVQGEEMGSVVLAQKIQDELAVSAVVPKASEEVLLS